MKRKTKQNLFLIGVAILVIGVILFFVLRDKDESYSSDFQESNREDTIVYGGKEYRYNEHLSNYVFMGVDTREPITEYETREESGRADAIFLLSYDRVKKTVKCISIPRDTMTNVRMIAPDGTDLGTSVEHINMQYAFGDGKDESCRLVKEAVSALLYDIPIQGYCSLNMDGIAAAVEVLGSVEMVLADNSLEDVNAEYVKGAKITVTKENAEQIIRHRDTDVSQSAIARTNRQKELMKAVSDCAREKSTQDADFIVDMYESLKPYMVSNIGNDVLADLLEAKFDSENGVIDIPGEGVEGELYDEYHIDETSLYELVLQMFYEEV
jgi:LCP family protein required for cell wall assembly